MSDNSTKAIYAAVGELAINWNFAENWIRNVAGLYAGKDAVGEIFTLELGAVSLQNVLCAISKHCPIGTEAGHLQYCADLYERLRAYRNYYIHGTVFAVEYEDKQMRPAGFTYTRSAKGVIRVYSARVESSQIQTVADQCYDLALFAKGIWSHLHGEPQGSGERPPLPDKPPLPPVLDKNAPYPQLQSTQPPASGV